MLKIIALLVAIVGTSKGSVLFSSDIGHRTTTSSSTVQDRILLRTDRQHHKTTGSFKTVDQTGPRLLVHVLRATNL
jgi:hypothetical protein